MPGTGLGPGAGSATPGGRARTGGRTLPFPAVGWDAARGIEINPYATELARIAVWIGEIRWMRCNGFAIPGKPNLRLLGSIECRDALLNEDGTEAQWPEADAITGNPPFLGGKLLLTTLGDTYVRTLFDRYDGRVPREADLVGCWFAKAREQIEAECCRHAGLVAANSLRGDANRRGARPDRPPAPPYRRPG